MDNNPLTLKIPGSLCGAIIGGWIGLWIGLCLGAALLVVIFGALNGALLGNAVGRKIILPASARPTIRKLSCLLAFLFILGYLVASRLDWFTKIALWPVARNPFFSENLDLGEQNTFTWKVPKGRWIYSNGKAQLSLVLNLYQLREVPWDRSQVELRAKISAFGVGADGERKDRLVKDWYYKTDEPFSKDGESLWQSLGRLRHEYGLGAVEVRPDEDLIIEVSVTVPDPHFSRANPRLKLVGAHDHAGDPYAFLLVDSLPDIGFVLSCVFLIVLFGMAWRKSIG